MAHDGTQTLHQVHDRAEVDDGDVPLLHRMKDKKEMLLLGENSQGSLRGFNRDKWWYGGMPYMAIMIQRPGARCQDGDGFGWVMEF